MLFIGYSFRDMNVRYIWHKLTALAQMDPEGKPVVSYFVTHTENPLLRELLRVRHIETILLSARSIKTDLEGLLRRMIEVQAS